MWVILAVLFVAIGAPAAHADSYTITFSGGTTQPVATVSGFSGDVLSFDGVSDMGVNINVNGPIFLGTTAMPQDDTYTWSILPESDGVDAFILVDGTSVTAVESNFPIFTYPDPFLFDSGTAVVTDTSIATPEPGTSVLMLIGIGSLGLMMVLRKRIAQGLPQAT
jgi:hypothetical protein